METWRHGDMETGGSGRVRAGEAGFASWGNGTGCKDNHCDLTF